ncbi:MAG: hypothetical protein V1886_03675 [archaeon]
MTRQKIRISKKAQLGETVALTVATLLIFFTIAIFFYLSTIAAGFQFRKNSDVYLAYSGKQQAMISLKAFLDTKVEFQGIETEIADIIRIDSIESNAIVKNKTEEIFKPFGSCYFFEAAGIKSGNTAYIGNTVMIILPVTKNKDVTAMLAVDSKCLEEKS